MSRESIPTGKNKGIKYEERIGLILKNKGLMYGTTGGASSNPDVYINHNDSLIPIEIKKDLSADYAQIELRWNNNGFYYSEKCMNPAYRQFLIDETDFLEEINSTWDGIPRKFAKKNHTDDDRNSDLDNFPDIKRKIDASYIEEFYTTKNPPVNYMQIGSNGFYYLKENLLSLNADRLKGEAILRARVKTRSKTNNKWGFLVAIKLRKVAPSKYDIEENTGKIFPFN